MNSSVATNALVKINQDGWRQGRKGLWKGEAEGGFEERQGWTPVPRWQVGIILLEEEGGWLVWIGTPQLVGVEAFL